MAFSLFVFQLLSKEKKGKSLPPLDISDKIIPAGGCFAFICTCGAAAKHSSEEGNFRVLLKNSLSKKNKCIDKYLRHCSQPSAFLNRLNFFLSVKC